jgi:Ca2+:H+ antiporter
MIALWLLALVPVAPLLQYGFGAGPLWVFLFSAAAVGVLAEWIRRATEQLAARTGSAIGGLLTVSFGSVAELLLALFVLIRGEVAIVQAQITGSIIGTSLLGLGLAIIAGGATRERQSFKRERAGLLASLLILAVIALLLPAVFNYTGGSVVPTRNLGLSDESLSIGVSVVLLALYGANLVYTLVTHRDVFAPGEESDDEASWSTTRAIAVLVAATAAIALESELVSGALTATASTLHLTPLFLGVVVLALVGTVSDLFAAVYFARQDRMGLVMSICIGSAIQVALVVAPLLVILSWLIGHPMTLVFSNPLDLFAIAGTAFIVNAITSDGETTWFEGVLLAGVYVLLALAYFFVGTAA